MLLPIGAAQHQARGGEMLVGLGKEKGKKGKWHRAGRAGHGLSRHSHGRKVARYRTDSSSTSAWLVHETHEGWRGQHHACFDPPWTSMY